MNEEYHSSDNLEKVNGEMETPAKIDPGNNARNSKMIMSDSPQLNEEISVIHDSIDHPVTKIGKHLHTSKDININIEGCENMVGDEVFSSSRHADPGIAYSIVNKLKEKLDTDDFESMLPYIILSDSDSENETSRKESICVGETSENETDDVEATSIKVDTNTYETTIDTICDIEEPLRN